MALGEAEWAATQTEHFAASVVLECWCVMNAIADQNVSNMHTNAILFEIDSINGYPTSALFESIPKRETKAMSVHCPVTLDPDEGSSPLVTTNSPTPPHPTIRTQVVSASQATGVLFEWQVRFGGARSRPLEANPALE